MRLIPLVAALVGSLLSPERGFADEIAGRPATQASAPITLRTRIPLPGVYGRMDHYGWDSKRGRLLVAALGNDTVEIIGDWRRRHSITGLEHPQAVVYVPGADRIAVSDQSGKVRFYDASSYELVRTVDFGEYANADNMRYDARSKLLYVGYGSGSRGAIATIDPATMERRSEYKLGSHPESFQLETSGSRLFVNLPDQSSVGVIDLGNGAVSRVENTRSLRTSMRWPSMRPTRDFSRPRCSRGGSA